MSGQRRPYGPYDTAHEALAAAAALTAAIRAADPGYGPMTESIRAARWQARVDYLTSTLNSAGVQLGDYDRRIAVWLADGETETLQVLVGWIERAHGAGLAAGDETAEPPSTVSTAPMHLGDLVAGEWAPACGQPYGADVTGERAAVTCPACVGLLAPGRRPEPEFTRDEVDAERALDAYLAQYPTDGPDGGA
jgi:hypothetical protein